MTQLMLGLLNMVYNKFYDVASASVNTAGRINHVRHNQFGIRRSTIIEHNEDVLLPDYLNSKIYGFYRNEDSENNLYSV